MLGEATGKTELDWLAWEGVPPGPGPSRGPLPSGPSLPWFILLRKVRSLAPHECLCLHPGPHQGPGKVSTTSHTLPLAPPGRAEACLGHQPNALFLSSLCLGVVVIFSASPPPRLLSLFQSLRSGSPPPAPGTSLSQVTVASVP